MTLNAKRSAPKPDDPAVVDALKLVRLEVALHTMS
jgi:hypothetical protein